VAEAVRGMFETYAAGATLRSLAKSLDSLRERGWCSNGIAAA